MFLHSLLIGALALLQAGGLQVPAPVGLVNDFAHVLPAQTADLLTRVAQDVRIKSRGEMAIVTLPDLHGRDPSEIALQIGRQWKVGKLGDPGDPTRNAGVVILLVPKETNADGRGYCRIEVGRGSEGFITDADAGSICREATPFFRNRDYASGLQLVTLLVAQRFANEFHFTLDTSFVAPTMPAEQPSGGGGIPPVVWLILLFVLLSLLGGGRRRGCLPLIFWGGGWGGGGRGGWGGGGFGGGGFGGGGGGGFGGFGGGGGFSGGGGGSSW